MKKINHAKLYYQWARTGKITHYLGSGFLPNGLCNSPVDSGLLELLGPTGDDHRCGGYWGFDGETDTLDAHTFTPLRQNIVLFIAAMNNEL